MIFTLLQGNPSIGITWSTLCNNEMECYGGLDERDCEFSNWLIPSFVCGAAILLCFTLSCYILKAVKRASNEILQDRQWRLVTSQPIDKRVAKLFKIASLVEKKYFNEIQNILKIEIDIHQNEGEAICYIKVEQIFSISFYISIPTSFFEFITLRTYWILWHLKTFKAFLYLNLLGKQIWIISKDYLSPFLFKPKMYPLWLKPTCRICKILSFHGIFVLFCHCMSFLIIHNLTNYNWHIF